MKKKEYRRDEKALRLLGKRIKELRTQQKISQQQLAFDADIVRNQLIRIENGKVNTGVSTLVAIAKALDVAVKDLIDF